MKRLFVLYLFVLAGCLLFTSCTKQYTITVQANNADWGFVIGGGLYESQQLQKGRYVIKRHAFLKKGHSKNASCVVY